MVRIAINGYGRIGRCVLRALSESQYANQMKVVAINEPSSLDTIAHLTQYDSTHGRFCKTVSVHENGLLIDDHFIQVTHHKKIDDLAWGDLGVDIVFECSGVWHTVEQLDAHIRAGAKRVLLSQPGKADVSAFVFGVNHAQLTSDLLIASAASCTTNAIVPVIDALNKAFGVVNGSITTLHSIMNDQPVVDGYHNTDLHKTRSAIQSMIPVSTGLATGIARILPEFKNRFVARAIRVPIANVSAIEMTAQLTQEVTIDDVNECLRKVADAHDHKLMGYCSIPLASCDYNHDARSCVVDAGQTSTAGQLVTVLVWFDNEWGYANRMLDLSHYWCAL